MTAPTLRPDMPPEEIARLRVCGNDAVRVDRVNVLDDRFDVFFVDRRPFIDALYSADGTLHPTSSRKGLGSLYITAEAAPAVKLPTEAEAIEKIERNSGWRAGSEYMSAAIFGLRTLNLLAPTPTAADRLRELGASEAQVAEITKQILEEAAR